MIRWTLDLDKAAGAEVHGLPSRQFQHQLFDKSCNISVRENSALPSLYTEDLLGYLNLDILSDCNLTGEAHSLGGLMFRGMHCLGEEYLATTFQDFDAAPTTLADPATRRQINASVV